MSPLAGEPPCEHADPSFSLGLRLPLQEDLLFGWLTALYGGWKHLKVLYSVDPVKRRVHSKPVTPVLCTAYIIASMNPRPPCVGRGRVHGVQDGDGGADHVGVHDHVGSPVHLSQRCHVRGFASLPGLTREGGDLDVKGPCNRLLR